ncbi:transcriptional regulator [Cyclonatronum proteinivorum]|uniref:Transcriptional regulator n=1 Tax=Cyclonatronum proteinivorum TaxID=1457365 RepID=A0A345UMA1_9BACT|nr:transcriptional regulator [Cyclonatronum proteinivorum]AXJ01603.1 transcriptional regulator [Cyclonatronum proteinivorum]
MKTYYKNFSHRQLDALIHNRLRLAILSAVAHSEEVDFMSLKNAVKTTDGNLSIQLRKLEEAGYVAINRSVQVSRKQTNVALTNKGFNALQEYKALVLGWLNL